MRLPLRSISSDRSLSVTTTLQLYAWLWGRFRLRCQLRCSRHELYHIQKTLRIRQPSHSTSRYESGQTQQGRCNSRPLSRRSTHHTGLLCSGVAGWRADQQAQQLHKHSGILTDPRLRSGAYNGQTWLDKCCENPCVRAPGAFNSVRTPTF
jgi:hypothetical protein